MFFSRTGKVRRVAEAIADELGADVEEIVDTRNRRGVFGLLSAARDAILRRTARIEEPAHDPADYDLVVIGTPVWGWSPSAPVRGYLARVRDRLPQVAFFAVARGQGPARAVRVMGILAEVEPRGDARHPSHLRRPPRHPRTRPPLRPRPHSCTVVS